MLIRRSLLSQNYYQETFGPYLMNQSNQTHKLAGADVLFCPWIVYHFYQDINAALREYASFWTVLIPKISEMQIFIQSADRMRERDSYDYRMNIVFLGVPYVGKTSLFQRLFNQSFGNSSYRYSMMIWNNYHCYIDGSRIRMRVEDTGGTERYSIIMPTYYRGADGIVFVFDVCNRETLLKIDTTLNQVNNNSRKFCIKMLVGNKIDDPNRQVSEQQGKAFAEERNMLYMQASAKEDINVDKIFITLAQKILYQQKDPKYAKYLIGSEPVQVPNYRRTCC